MNPQSDAARLLRNASSVQLIGHISPDGDTIGSALGLAWALRDMGKVARVACADPVPRALRFLPGADEVRQQAMGGPSLVVAVDCSDQRRMGSAYDAQMLAGRPLLVIDHHESNQGFGDVNLIEPQAAATTQIMLRLIAHLGVPLSTPIATCLLTGLITDTQGFRTHNTDSGVLADAVTLCDAGAPLTEIMDQSFGRSPISKLRLWGSVFERCRLENGVLWAEVSRQDIARAGASSETLRGLVNYLATIDEAQIALLLEELPNGRVDVSLRARPGYNVAVVASALGGGGHELAAGCQVNGALSEVRATVLDALSEQMLARA